MTAILTDLFALLGAVGTWLEDGVAAQMIGDQVNIAGGPPGDGLSDFFAGLIMMVGTHGAGLGEVVQALGVWLGSLA